MLAAQTQEAAAQLMRGREVNWGAMPLTGVFETADGALVMVGAFKADPIGDIGKALGVASLKDRPALHDACAPGPEQAGAASIFRERFKSDTTANWLARLEAQDLLCAPVRTLAEALADEQAAINGMVIECDGEVERCASSVPPIHFEDAPVSIRIPPAHLGQHTAEVLAELDRPRMRAAS